ncbi:MAG: hypothetical protein IKJ45_05030 [Kiritimatiellae bacterium]|nr:hypothetical protein [Kiritimatiellia bacterium]
MSIYILHLVFCRYSLPLLDKISKARELFPDVLIEVDGGVNLSNCAKIVQAGADVIVAGSAVFNSENRKDAIQQLKMG